MVKFEDFIKDTTMIVEKNQVNEETVTKIENLLYQLISCSTWLPKEKCTVNNDHYARYPIYRDPNNRFEIIAIVWKPGQKTPIHDHDGTWGVEGVMQGRIKVKNYLKIEKLSEDKVKLRHSGILTIDKKSTGQILPPADCHTLEADGVETAITIHVYGKQLRKFNIFDPIDNNETYLVREHHV